MIYVDPVTGAIYPINQARWRSDTGGHLNLAPSPGLHRGEIDSECRSAWRYARALLVEKAASISLGEGWTPLIRGAWERSPVAFKLEFLMPTGSFKDRGMTVMVSYLKSRGIDHVLEDSSGNAGASLSAYAAAAGMRCRILVPETTSYPKIVQIAACGAEVMRIKGTRQDVADEATRQSEQIFYASHNWQPLFVEGIKTLAYELWEQLEYCAPDNVVVPLGYGSNILGCERGFTELLRNGEITKMPRFFGVQAANCAPCCAAFKAGVNHLVPTEITSTVAEGIASPKPTRLTEILTAVRQSGGGIVAVSEEEIVTALGKLARMGLYVEPTSAAAAAGLTQLQNGGVIVEDQTTVLVLTGSGLKASEQIGQLLNLRTLRTRSHLLPARGLGTAKSVPD